MGDDDSQVEVSWKCSFVESVVTTVEEEGVDAYSYRGCRDLTFDTRPGRLLL